MDNVENLEKQMLILDLLDEVEIPQPLMMYYDFDSTKLLDLKIEVLQELKKGVPFEDIRDAETIFELLPIGQHWD